MMISVLPGEAAIVAICSLFEKIVDGQPPEVKAEMWKRWMEFTKPFHDAAVRGAKALADVADEKQLAPSPNKR